MQKAPILHNDHRPLPAAGRPFIPSFTHPLSMRTPSLPPGSNGGERSSHFYTMPFPRPQSIFSTKGISHIGSSYNLSSVFVTKVPTTLSNWTPGHRNINVIRLHHNQKYCHTSLQTGTTVSISVHCCKEVLSPRNSYCVCIRRSNDVDSSSYK